jgi:hypothetical protein
MKTKKSLIIIGVLVVSLTSFFISAKFFSPVKSTPVNYLKNQLSSAQLSYFARLDGSNTADNSIIKINTGTTVAPSTSNYNLFVGDTIAIANSGGGSDIYTVRDIADTNAIFIDPTLKTENTSAGAYVIATRSAVHNISFSPTTSVTEGKWQVLIKATSLAGEDPSDGIPDQGGFDALHLTNSDVTCPWGATAEVGTTAVLESGSGVSPSAIGTYHVITCALNSGGTNPTDIGVTGTIVIGGDSSNHQLINPAPAIGHTVGQASAAADTHTFILRHLDSAGTIIDNDTSIGKIALTESVRVTAIIDPTITFYIDNDGATITGTRRCGDDVELSAGAPQTTATSVNFGSLSLGQFNTLAQRFTCSTNAVSGYVVQVFETAPLTITSAGSTSTIPDTTCDSGCTIDSAGAWNTSMSESKFGYSLDAISGSPVAFTHNNVFNAKPFGVGYSNARPIMSRNSTPTTEDRAYICYRITASNFQEAGIYQNQINFIATATF